MSHGLDVAGSSMVSARDMVPWHNHPSCRVVSEIKDVVEGLDFSGMNWIAEKRRLFYQDENGNYVDGKAFAVVRKDTGALLTEGRAVGPQFTVLQNKDAFAWFQPFLDSGLVKLDTAGALHGGSRVWVMALITGGTMEIAKGDAVEKYLLLSHAHDGTLAVRVGFTPVRVVCANTLAMAHSDKDSKLVRIRHSGQVKANLDALRETVNVWSGEFEATAEKYKFLCTRQINSADLEKYIKIVFDMKATEKSDGKLPTRSVNILADIVNRFDKDKLLNAFEAGKGSDIARGSWWNAYNAVTDYLSHERGNSIETRLDSLWFGNSFNTSRRALDLAVSVASNQISLT